MDYIIQESIKTQNMSKGHNSSYQGFRRKNSLNSIEVKQGSSPSELSFLKFRHNEHLSEVQNLSMQLEDYSKRSLSSRSFCDEKPKHCHSSNNIHESFEGVTQNLYFHSSRKQEFIPQKKEQFFQGKNEKSLRKDKVNNSAIFNKFQVIQEDHYQNQQEQINQIEPVTFKPNPASKVREKKFTAKLVNIKQVSQPQPLPKKNMNAPKTQIMGVKKEKMKLQLNELDKMQKQLDSKRSMRQDNTTRSMGISNVTKKGKQHIAVTLKDNGKIGKPITALPQHKMLGDSTKKKQAKSSANIFISAKMSESKQQVIQQEKKDQFIPTRMLNEKEKNTLLQKIEHLKQIIETNDICAQNMNELINCFSKIQKLLTK